MKQETLGEAVLQMRAKRELTQVELAEMLDVAPLTVSRWERGETVSLTIGNARKLVALGVPSWHFMPTGVAS